MLTSIVRLIKKVVIILIAIACIVVGGLFAFENPDKISPVIKGYVLPSLSIGHYLALFLLMGVLIGLALSLWGSQSKQFNLKRENNRLRRDLKKQESLSLQSADVDTSS